MSSLQDLAKLGGEQLDLGDAFALLHSHCMQVPPSALEVSRSVGSDTPDVGRLAELWSTVGLIPKRALASAVASADARLVFGLLRSIDGALGTIDPYVGTPIPAALERYRERYESEHRLNRHAVDGLVIPRRTGPGRPRSSKLQDWRDSLPYTLRIAHRPEASIRFARIDTEWDFPSVVRATETVTVAALPFIDSMDQMEICRVVDPEGQDWYSIAPKPLTKWDGNAHVAEALKQLDDSGAHIGVLPELTAHDELVEAWQEAMRATPRPAHSVLEWIFVGSGPLRTVGGASNGEQPPNRMLVLHRGTGQIVRLPNGRPFFQDKNRGFTMDPDTIGRWGLSPFLQPPGSDVVDLGEWMLEGHDRIIVDTRVGRIAVLICEDHGRLLGEVAGMLEFGPSHVIVPILSEPIRRHYWEEKGGRQIASELGSTTIVVNSSVVAPSDYVDGTGYGAVMTYVDRESSPNNWPVQFEGAAALRPALETMLFEAPIG